MSDENPADVSTNNSFLLIFFLLSAPAGWLKNVDLKRLFFFLGIYFLVSLYDSKTIKNEV